MDNKLIYILLITVLASSVTAQSNLTAAGADVDVTLLRYEPLPAQPGDQVEIWVKVENNGGDTKRGVEIKFLDNYPISLQTGEKRVHTIGNLQGGSGYVAKFRARIDNAATSGTANVALKYTSQADGYRRLFLPIDIKSRITSLRIINVTTTPKQFTPGGNGNLTFTLQNIADTLVQDVTVKLQLSNSSAPLAPSKSSTELKIDQLSSNQARNFTFKLVTKYDAEPNVYRIPVTISFTDETGHTMTYNDLVGVRIADKPSLITTIETSKIYKDDTTGTVTLKFVNKGADEIKFVTVHVNKHSSYELLSPARQYYVGNIDSDDYELQELNIQAKNNIVKLPLTIQYSDASNTPYTRNKTLKLELVKKSTFTDEKSNYTWLYVSIGILLVLFWWWKRRRNAR